MRTKYGMRPGDIVIVHGRGTTARLIRRFTRSRGEPKTRATHVGVAVGNKYVVEALWRGVVRRRYRAGTIYRQKNLSAADVEAIVDHALSCVGLKYGYTKIALQALDGLPPWRGKFLFRRLGFIRDLPICSRLVADGRRRVGYVFGVDPRAATPDDLEDWILAHPDHFDLVKESA